MNTVKSVPTSFVVVLLDDLWIGDELVEKGTAVPVDRPLRNDWVGSKMARDATDEELEEFRAEELEAAAEAAVEAEKAAKKNAAK